jgi:hypothetical protein
MSVVVNVETRSVSAVYTFVAADNAMQMAEVLMEVCSFLLAMCRILNP